MEASTMDAMKSKNRSSEIRRKNRGCSLRRRSGRAVLALAALSIVAFPALNTFVIAANDDYYAADDDRNNANDEYNYYNGDDGAAAADDAYAAADDDAYAGDDKAAQGDDANAAADDYYAAATDDDGNYAENDDAYSQEKQQYQQADDDVFHWESNDGFEGVSVMPLSCINYNSGHMIKFQLFDSANSYQCHFAEISTFVVSIAHYMRAYFNYQALRDGTNFKLPSDAAYLNCIALQVDGTDTPLYAKIGCMERETFTSTKLQIHIYTDTQCSRQYDDGQSAHKHATKGYVLGNTVISTKVSFKPDFYSCITCLPDQISETFNKVNSNWYDDDYISQNGNKQQSDDEDDGVDDDEADDQAVDDKYFAAYDDNYASEDDQYANDQYKNNGNGYQQAQSDDQYNANNGGDDNYGGNRRILSASMAASESALQLYEDSFWEDVHDVQRRLYDNDKYDAGEWNMCQRVYKYGVWCDEECRSLDFFRTDMWSASDIFLLSIMCTFMSAMMLLVIAKRLKAQQKARVYGEEHAMPGLPPCAMAIIFVVIMAVIVSLSKLKFINETLVFAVVTCILLFIYMLKLTLFENRRPVLLAAPRHDMFDNPLDDHLFE